jgi:hypothetical protein
MAAKLGSTDVSFRLGATTPAAVYLGAVPVWTAVFTLYFNNAEEDGDWATLGNWWLDQGHTVPATALPGPGNDVVLAGLVSLNSGSPITVRNFEGASSAVDISFTATGLATFYATFSGTLTGNAAFNDSSNNSGTVTGNATFNDSSNNSGTVTGNATFNDSSGLVNGGTVTGNATFNSGGYNDGTVGGNATFNDGTVNYGTVTGTATFTGSACNDGGTAGTFVPDPPPSC